MTIEEIFKDISTHMLKGIMIHQQLANYYDFLGLEGYKRCHEYHFLEETHSYRKFQSYFINHYGKLLKEEGSFDSLDVIPAAWYGVLKEDVDKSTKQSAVKAGLELWVSWERQTKKKYEKMYQELVSIGEISAACFLKDFIEDVDKELIKAQKYWIYKKAISYDMNSIIAEQKEQKTKYKEKISHYFWDQKS